MTGLRPLLRRTAYRSQILTLARCIVRHALTAVMFHRVMDPADPDFDQADPVYTIPAPLFEQILDFLRDHYAVVDIQRVIDAADGIRPLPDHALLITFDDGWADNLRYAAPLLRARGMPAVIFVAAEAVREQSTAWWQEEVFALNRAGGLRDWLALLDNRTLDAPEDDPVAIVTRLALMDAGQRDRILATLPHRPCHARMMLDACGLRRLTEFGIAIGLHGNRHVPLPDLADVAGEVADARSTLTAMTAGTDVAAAFACPYGRYDERSIAALQNVGIKVVFTSDKLLNATERGMLTRQRPLGRIGIATRQVEAAHHRLDPAATARQLWSHACR